MSIDRLITRVTPPEVPYGIGDPARWSEFETELDTSLPSDYKAFVDTYGAGSLGDLIHVFTPFAVVGAYNFRLRSAEILDEDRRFRGDWPHALFPDPGGLLPWGVSDHGHTMYWIVGEDPDSWTIEVWESRWDADVVRDSPGRCIFGGSMSTLLLALVEANGACPVLPAPIPATFDVLDHVDLTEAFFRLPGFFDLHRSDPVLLRSVHSPDARFTELVWYVSEAHEKGEAERIAMAFEFAERALRSDDFDIGNAAAVSFLESISNLYSNGAFPLHAVARFMPTTIREYFGEVGDL